MQGVGVLTRSILYKGHLFDYEERHVNITEQFITDASSEAHSLNFMVYLIKETAGSLPCHAA